MTPVHPPEEFGAWLRETHKVTTRQLESTATKIIVAGKGVARIDDGVPVPDPTTAPLSVRAYFRHWGIVYNWSDKDQLRTISLTDRMLTAIGSRERRDGRRVQRINKNPIRDDNLDVVDPVGGPTTILEYRAAELRIAAAAERALRKPRPPTRPYVENPDLVLWEDFIRERVSAAEFARRRGISARTMQYRLRVSRDRLAATSFIVEALLPELRTGRPETRKFSGVRGEGQVRPPPDSLIGRVDLLPSFLFG